MAAFLIYGPTGYTGTLVAEHAVECGLRPILAGRRADALQPLAERLGLEWRCFSLDSSEALERRFSGVRAVLHAAGPFSATARPMVAACLQLGLHYVDITGEIDVFESLAVRDAEARHAGIMMLPGAGFDVVPSDCLAAHVAGRLPTATRLRLSVGGFGGFSRGTAKTMVESVAYGTRARRNGRIVELSETPRGMADFGAGLRPTVGLGWGDVSTAWRSTGIPDIDVHFQASPAMARAAALPRFLKRLLAAEVSQRLIKRAIETRLPPGPSPAQRRAGRSVFLAEAWDAAGRHVASRLETLEAYTLTALTAVEIARRATAGDVKPGYQTPATAFGADFILGFDGSERLDLS